MLFLMFFYLKFCNLPTLISNKLVDFVSVNYVSFLCFIGSANLCCIMSRATFKYFDFFCFGLKSFDCKKCHIFFHYSFNIFSGLLRVD